MDVVITLMQPNPITVHNGGSRPVMFQTTALKAVQGGQLQLENLRPAGAEITLNGQSGDVVTVPAGDLVKGQNHLTVTVALTLEGPNSNSGAIIGMVARILDKGRVVISPDFPFLTVIGAA
jgi:hypothetical protein